MDSPEHYDGVTASKRAKQEGELEVTGISRSGRVRKKSSKLTDFESPDEIDRHRRKNEKTDFPQGVFSRTGLGSPKKQQPTQQMKSSESFNSDEEDNATGNFPLKEDAFSESDSELGMFPQADDGSSMDSMGSPMEDEDMDEHLSAVDQDSSEGFQRIVPEAIDGESTTPGSAQSLYMLEKSSKKKLIIRDGRIVGRMKAQRKDKGKTRFTAYMLWAKEIRQELMKANPELDFSQTSKKLGELWATVPFNEKYIWKRRAKRLAAKGGIRPDKPQPQVPGATVTTVPSLATTITTTASSASKKSKSTPTRKFINKQQQQQQPQQQLQQQQQQQQPTVSVSNSGNVGQQMSQNNQSPTSSNLAIASPSDQSAKSSSKSAASLVSEPVVGPGLYKVIGTQPIDVAAHLRLLGESLTIIGERLKEHDGQIAVSGSLSVLLDSLLCVLGPLLCLTQQVPEMNVCPQQQLTKILDNIAYIMPGL
ncbi:uncharacterized protein LOC142332908 isoform X1 [Lycorma delicatula]|uniref:uncharacterized protein LOC142332908 isoform X1 n=1 Tax=Lycorma delicatula TaxID=130591 RepID=UPI003F50D726